LKPNSYEAILTILFEDLDATELAASCTNSSLSRS
jgi:hypothetical protein